HGHDHSRSRPGPDQKRYDARSSESRTADSRLRCGIRRTRRRSFRSTIQKCERQEMKIIVALVIGVLLATNAIAQGRGQQAPANGRAAAQVDLTGYWVSVV